MTECSAYVQHVYAMSNDDDYKLIYNTISSHPSDMVNGKKKWNISCQRNNISGNIPESKIPSLFAVIWNYLNKSTARGIIGISESQKYDESCIHLDFDFKQKHSNSITDEIIQKLRRTIINILIAFTANLPETIYVAVFTRPEITFKDKYYRNGLYIKVYCKMSYSHRRFIIEKINLMTLHMFKDFGLCDDDGNDLISFNNLCDKMSASIPVLLYKCIRRDRKYAYKIHSLMKCTIIEGSIEYEPIAVTTTEYKYNWALEFSLLYNGAIITKKSVTLKEEYAKEAIVYEDKSYNSSTSETHDTDDLLLSLRPIDSISGPVADELVKILRIIGESKNLKFNDYFQVISALANMTPSPMYESRYKTLALTWMKISKEYSQHAQKFDAIWDQNIRRPIRGMNYHYLSKMAKRLEPEKYKALINTSIIDVLKGEITSKYGTKDAPLSDITLRDIIIKCLCGKYVSDKSSEKESFQLYKFITNPPITNRSSIHKWQHVIADEYEITEIVTDIIKPLIKNMDDEFTAYQRRRSEELRDNKDQEVKCIGSYIKRIKRTYDKINARQSINSMIRSVVEKVYEYKFIESLDRDGNLLGVANGILDFNELPVKLADPDKQLRVTRYSESIYKEFDPNDELNIRLFEIILSLFPPDEQDACMYILFFAASALTEDTHKMGLLMLLGGGSNGKSSLINLLISSIINIDKNLTYEYSMDINYFTETKSNSQHHSSILVPLKYARIVHMCESEKDKKLHASKLKAFFNNEAHTVREIREKQCSVIPKASGLLSSNYIVLIDDFSYGLRRRTDIYNLKFQFLKEKDYERLKDIKTNKLAIPDVEHIHKKDEVKTSILSLMVFLNQLIRLKYKGNFNRIVSPTIEKETDAEYQRQNFIIRFINTRIYKYPVEVKEVKNIRLIDIANAYCIWYGKTIKTTKTYSLITISEQLYESSLKPFIISDEYDEKYLTNHGILDYDDKLPTGCILVGQSNSLSYYDTSENTLALYNNMNAKDIIKSLYSDYTKLLSEMQKI